MRALEKERKKNLKSSMERKHESVTTGFDQGWQISDISNLSETAHERCPEPLGIVWQSPFTVLDF